MAQNEEIIRRSATEIRNLIAKKDLSPVEVIEASLQQIEKYNKKINAVVTLNERALDDAKKLQSQKGEPGLLFGLPVGIKDVTPTAGLRTTFGSLLFNHHTPDKDALIVQRLKVAGAIIIGKTNTPEFAAGGHTWNDVFGVTRNPWNPDLSPGGSTGGGAAALATGMIALSDGTDLGGSLRIPASFCGIVGLRPSPGLVPGYPSDYLWDNLHIPGPMARTVEDVALMLQAVCGQSPLSPLYQPTQDRDFVDAVSKGIPKGLKVAYCKDVAGIGIDEDIEIVCRNAAFELSQAGVEVEEIDLDLSFARQAFLTLRGYNFVAHFAKYLDNIDQFGINVSNNLKAGLKVTPEELGAAEQARTKLWNIFRDLFDKYDHLLTPCMAVPPFPVEQNYPETLAGKKMETYIDWLAPTFVLSLAGLPVASVPCGCDSNGLPVGMQVVGKPVGEEAVLTFARLLQEAFPIGLPELSRLL
ncbi:amidase [candidate division KSB1 bacterium]|nr:amidase [candidate division KSB1 bacterium]TDI91362.1 MAG: amidase [Caldithrix sp.]TDI98972.1 MAG: amidase [Caldithrix sp.]